MSGNEKRYYIGVIGERFCGNELCEIAVKVGSLIAREGWILVCGGMGGIMEKACYGAFVNKGITIGIIPENTRERGNPYLSFSIVTGLGEGRNSIVVKNCDAVISIGGSYGTLSEIAFANLFGIPVVGIKSWKLEIDKNKKQKLFVKEVQTAEKAILHVKRILKE